MSNCGGTIKTIANFLLLHSGSPAVDIKNLLTICLYNYVIGNADNHLKNLSILYSLDWKSIRLAPAYDLVPTTLFRRFSRQMGMAIGSVKDIDKVSFSDLIKLAEDLHISEKLLQKTANNLTKNIVKALQEEGSRLHDKGFILAPYVADDIESEIIPRLKVLQGLKNL